MRMYIYRNKRFEQGLIVRVMWRGVGMRGKSKCLLAAALIDHRCTYIKEASCSLMDYVQAIRRSCPNNKPMIET